MPNLFSTLHPYNHHANNSNKYDPSKMFGLINCEHKGFVGFEFDDYPEDIILDVGKRPSLILNSPYGNGKKLLHNYYLVQISTYYIIPFI
jgi:hypothetical protein